MAPARGVLCVPDFIANARSVICAALLDRTADMPPHTAAEQMASARLDLARRLRRRF